jgi:alpha-glucoside transport system substrate-binding protein
MALNHTGRRVTAVLAGTIGLSMALVGCGGGSEGDSGASSSIDCAPYAAYGDLSGKTISVYTSIVSPEDKPHIDSYIPFEECTGADVTYEGSKEFEAQLKVRLEAGNPPDIAYIPQPGLLTTLVTNFPGKVVPASAETTAMVDESFDPGWKQYGTVDGTFYAPPLGSNVKSFVWYSPKMFKDAGYEIPKTWDEMLALSDKIAGTGVKPWCAGIGSGDATGWPVTDWVEDVLLRTAGEDFYDKWVNHEVPFNSPEVVKALDTAGNILRNDKYVNGGLGDVKSIAGTTFQEGGIPILSGECYMHRQASFYASNFVEAGAAIEDNADNPEAVWAFYLPPIDPAKKPILVAGEFVTAFADRPEVSAFMTYLASPEWANAKAKATPGGWVSANKGANPNNFSGIDRLSVEILQTEGSVQRFDGSDLMPGAVGAGSFWKQMTDWIATGKSTQDALDAIEASWPKS